MSEPCQVARDIRSKQLEGRNTLHDCIPDNNGTQHTTIILQKVNTHFLTFARIKGHIVSDSVLVYVLNTDGEFLGTISTTDRSSTTSALRDHDDTRSLTITAKSKVSRGLPTN